MNVRRFIIIPLIAAAMIFAFGAESYGGLEDRSSLVELKPDPYNRVEFPEVSAPSGNPTTNRGWLYVKALSTTTALYFEDDAGTVVQLGTAATQTLDGAYANGNTIDLDTDGDIELDLTVTARKVQIANTYAGTQAIALEIDAEAAQAITDGLLFACTAGTIVDAIDAKHASITNAINVGANVIFGTGGASINFDEFDVSGTTGEITINDGGDAGKITIESTVLDIDSLDAVGALEITAAASSAITLNPNAGNAAGEDLIVTAHNVQLTAGGAFTMSPDAAVTTAMTITDTDYTNWATVGDNDLLGTTGDINFTNFDLVGATGDLTLVGDATVGGDLTVTGTANLGTLAQDNLVPASASPQAITLNAGTTGKVQIGNSSTGAVELAGAGTLVDVLAGANLVISEGDLAITSTANEDVITLVNNTSTDKSAVLITQSATTTGKVISVTADGLTAGGVGLYIDSNGIPDNATFYVQLYDGAANDLTIAQHGEINIAGVASTDIITIDAGDLKLTTGDINLSDGLLTITNDADEANSITRNYAGAGTNPVLTVIDTHTSGTQVALLVENDGTGNSTGLQISHDGDYPMIDMDAGAARDGDGIDINMANMLDERAMYVHGAITGAAGEGVLEIHGTGVIPATASLLRLDADTAQPGDGSGYCLIVDDDTLVVATPTHYAVTIDSNANGALSITKGAVSIAGSVNITNAGLLNLDEDLDIDFDTNDEEVDVSSSATDYAANSAMVTFYNSGAGQTNAHHLLRLRHNADADAQDHFLVCEDNNTTDVMFSVNSGGAVTAAGALSATGIGTFTGGLSTGNAATSYLHTDTVALSNADIKALRGTKKELVATPGANNFIEVVSVVLLMEYGSNVLTETADNLVVEYATSGQDITAAIEMTGFIDQAADQVAFVLPAGIATMTTANCSNNAVQLFNTGDGEFGGNAGNDTLMRVKITYRIHPDGM